MYCTNCGNQVQPEDSFCRSCGHRQNKEPINARSPVSSTKAYEESKQIAQSDSNSSIKTFVGNNVKYYINKWENYVFPHKYAGWNWAAFFLGPVWFAYRKMYLRLIAFYGIYLVVIFMTVVIPSLPMIVDQNKFAAATILLIIIALMIYNFLIQFIVGAYGNRMYYNHTKRKIESINSKYSDVNQDGERRQAFHIQGSTSIGNAIVMFIFEIVTGVFVQVYCVQLGT